MSGGACLTRRRLLVAACAVAPAPAAAARWTRRTWRGRALGADARITLSGPPDAVEAALPAAVAALKRAEALYSLFDAESALSRLNAQGRLASPPAELRDLLALCDRVHGLTGGAFDPTVQPLWRALADNAGANAVSHARGLVGWHRVDRRATAVSLEPGQALTLNGIAQGAAADAVVAALRANGIGHALVNTGEFVGLAGPWQVGVADPEQGMVAARRLTDGAIATSSPAALRLGFEATHILSPRGVAEPIWSTASVEATHAALADGVSTAACMMPVAALRELLRRAPAVRRITLIGTDGRLLTLT